MRLLLLLTLLLPGSLVSTAHAQPGSAKIVRWLTDPEAGIFFQPSPDTPSAGNGREGSEPVIRIGSKTYQSIDGFGFALTGGSAQHIVRMSPAARKELLTDLFSTSGEHIGTSYLRLSIGASDLNEQVFSYDDLPAGETDPQLKKFDLGPDKTDVVPVVKEILKIFPGIKIMGSPWSPPVWMKDNKDTRGGSLLPEYYQVYANYLVRYVQEMKKQGIVIDAMTVQNEPLHPGNNPSLLMLPGQQLTFVKEALGPAFRKAGLKTKIILYDHNADRPDYPISILNDPEARKFIDGSAFHLYAGPIDTLSTVHDAHPDKNLYFTEQWVGAPGNSKRDIAEHVRKLIIGATRNWCKTVIEWNLAADPNNDPHTDRGGCDRCLGAVTIDGDKVTRNPAYYIIAHAAKFVRPGSVRIESNLVEGLPNVAFRTPAKKTVLIVFNHTKEKRAFTVEGGSRKFTSTLPAGATATYVW